MKISFDKDAWKDYVDWASNKRVQEKINDLIKSITRTPYEGIGQPEPLKYELSGLWSRRITPEHRMVYKIIENEETSEIEEVQILAVKTHYD
jgi:toxin YoeB